MKLEEAMRIYTLHKTKLPPEPEDSVSARMSETVVALGDAVVELLAKVNEQAADLKWVNGGRP